MRAALLTLGLLLLEYGWLHVLLLLLIRHSRHRLRMLPGSAC